MPKARILIVDDEESIRELFAELLQRWGYEVDQTADGHGALKLAAETHPDVIISDLVMPKLDGLALVRALREEQPDTPVVVITGQSGTGKEMVARAIHQLSPRRDKPFIAINCSAIPASLIESEMFGHERGAFTGAEQRRLGAWELADGGTLFLDEVGEIPIELQAKFLRVLEEERLRRLGGKSEIAVDVRVISATNRELKDEIKAGRFREDLYFRLNVFHIN